MAEEKKFTIVVTRPVDDCNGFIKEIVSAGFDYLLLPSISRRKTSMTDEIREVLTKLSSAHYKWIIFTSGNAVKTLYEHQMDIGEKPSLPRRVRIAVQGSATREAVRSVYGREVDLMPEEFVLESLGQALCEKDILGAEILHPTSSQGRDVLTPMISSVGAVVTRIFIYETIRVLPSKEALNRLLNLDTGDLVFTFFSPSAVESTSRNLREHPTILQRSNIASIGPVTSKALSEAGLHVFVEAKNHTESGLLEAIKRRLPL